jgi:hypothetical protein
VCAVQEGLEKLEMLVADHKEIYESDDKSNKDRGHVAAICTLISKE